MLPFFQFLPTESHRKDIDGLRAIAVAAAILFHVGVLPKGYLGVDIFFVISGFLITGIIYRESQAGMYSLTRFYLRRARRILPLTIVVSLAAMIIGMVVMLPDDLENLAQSVIATSLCANNVLQALTTRNYWDVVNEYKPLMHTWSLAIEEQYYFLYPFLFVPFQRKRARLVLPVIGVMAAVSLTLFLLEPAGYQRFYFLKYRFFELAIGGVVAVLLRGRVVDYPFSGIPLVGAVLVLLLPLAGVSGTVLLLAEVFLTCGVLATANSRNRFAASLLENPISIYVGRISFSLYMWHQLVLAFVRYAWWPRMSVLQLCVVMGGIVCLSALTYRAVEQPFRSFRGSSLRAMLAWLLLGYGITLGLAGYVYARAGVIRDVPELGISSNAFVRNMHGAYNDRVYRYDRPFSDDGRRVKVLVVGDSFARDWANVLRESRFDTSIEICYCYYTPLGDGDHGATAENVRERAGAADVVFVSRGTPELLMRLGLASTNVWVVGPKNFGANNGVYYNSWRTQKTAARSPVPDEMLRENDSLSQAFAPRFIDLVTPLLDAEKRVPVFTPDGRFISQDTRHLTQDGARYFAKVLDGDLARALSIATDDRRLPDPDEAPP
ncbi:MAG: acyltransferase family protein [Planctomycetota bacterium]